MTKQLVENFKSLDITDYPNIGGYELDRQKIFWLLWVAREKTASEYLNASQISRILADVYHINISRHRVSALLKNEKKKIGRKRVSNHILFKIMDTGLTELSNQDTVILIQPENALTDKRKLGDLFGALKGTIKICDPYLARSTVDALCEFSNVDEIRFLTVNLNDKKPLIKADALAFVKQYKIRLEIHHAAGAKLHDRYILHDDGMLLLGTSLNGLGNKQSFIVELGHNIKNAVELEFDKLWASTSSI